jgi:hypothetical protein
MFLWIMFYLCRKNPMKKRGLLPFIAVLAFISGTGGAIAQTVGPDEAVGPDGTMSQKLALTAAQKSAIYNAVIRQRVRPFAVGISPTVGTPVPPSVALGDLPDQAAADNPWEPLLKYAMVEDDIVVVDPIGMLVVDVIHGRTKP